MPKSNKSCIVSFTKTNLARWKRIFGHLYLCGNNPSHPVSVVIDAFNVSLSNKIRSDHLRTHLKEGHEFLYSFHSLTHRYILWKEVKHPPVEVMPPVFVRNVHQVLVGQEFVPPGLPYAPLIDCLRGSRPRGKQRAVVAESQLVLTVVRLVDGITPASWVAVGPGHLGWTLKGVGCVGDGGL